MAKNHNQRSERRPAMNEKRERFRNRRFLEVAHFQERRLEQRRLKAIREIQAAKRQVSPIQNRINFLHQQMTDALKYREPRKTLSLEDAMHISEKIRRYQDEVDGLNRKHQELEIRVIKSELDLLELQLTNANEQENFKLARQIELAIHDRKEQQQKLELDIQEIMQAYRRPRKSMRKRPLPQK